MNSNTIIYNFVKKSLSELSQELSEHIKTREAIYVTLKVCFFYFWESEDWICLFIITEGKTRLRKEKSKPFYHTQDAYKKYEHRCYKKRHQDAIAIKRLAGTHYWVIWGLLRSCSILKSCTMHCWLSNNSNLSQGVSSIFAAKMFDKTFLWIRDYQCLI